MSHHSLRCGCVNCEKTNSSNGGWHEININAIATERIHARIERFINPLDFQKIENVTYAKKHPMKPSPLYSLEGDFHDVIILPQMDIIFPQHFPYELWGKMIIEKEELNIFTDPLVNKPLYAHQKYVLNHDGWDQLKIHTPTSSGKTLSAVLLPFKAKFDNPSTLVKTILTFPTNLLSQKQFEASIVDGLTNWVGAQERIRGNYIP